MTGEEKCWVYWIHLEKHTDITSEGYIGITTIGVSERFKRHLSVSRSTKTKRRTTRLVHSLRKYGDTVKLTTLLVGTLDYCQMVESRLRPTENIGWNLCVGGAATRVGAKNSPEHRKKVADANRGRKHSQSEIDANRERAIKQFTFDFPWQHPSCNKSVWSRADEIYLWFIAHPVDGRRTVGKALSMPSDSVLLPLAKIKDGWIPTDDIYWISFRDSYNNKESNSVT